MRLPAIHRSNSDTNQAMSNDAATSNAVEIHAS